MENFKPPKIQDKYTSVNEKVNFSIIGVIWVIKNPLSFCGIGRIWITVGKPSILEGYLWQESNCKKDNKAETLNTRLEFDAIVLLSEEHEEEERYTNATTKEKIIILCHNRY